MAVPPAHTRLLTSSLSEPVAVAGVPGDAAHLAVCELPGRVRVVDAPSGQIRPAPMLDITPFVAAVGDGGLLGLAFDPAYAVNGFVYVFYNNLGDNDRVLARYRVPIGTLVADPNSRTVLWKFARPVGHNGGWIGFSPVNGLLYLSMGDGGNGFSFDAPNRAQTITNTLMGKMLRIDVGGDDFPGDPDRNYRVPITNPFFGAFGDDEIWAYGLRNPWRCSFDRLTGDLYIADVGQDMLEEVDMEPAAGVGGRNYGWRCMEASRCTDLGGCTCFSDTITLPLFEYDHSLGQSITGGYVYRGAAIPEFQGLYIFGDFNTQRVWSFRPGAAGVTEFTDRSADLNAGFATGQVQNISAFGEDAAGELYIADFVGGKLWAILPGPCPADFNGAGGVTVQDIFDYLGAYFAGLPAGDFNHVGGVSVQDIFDFLTAYFAGCG